jgi:hypothetical protein
VTYAGGAKGGGLPASQPIVEASSARRRRRRDRVAVWRREDNVGLQKQ